MDSKARRHVSLDDLVSRVCSRFRITPDELASKRRKREISQARAALCYLAAHELDYSGEELARPLSIRGRAVSDCRDRGQRILLCRETSLSDTTDIRSMSLIIHRKKWKRI